MSANQVESAPEPLGAKATAPDPRATWRDERARLGGYVPAVEFSELQVAVLEAAADTMIPAGGGFPAPSEVEVVNFVSRYVTPRNRPLKYFPLAAEDDFKRSLDALGRQFVDGSSSERSEAIKALENDDTEGDGFFTQLRALVYYGYYSSPVVTEAIRQNLPAGRDYHGPPQPYGYAGKVEPWPEDALDHPRGGYIATGDVAPVDIPDDIKAEYGVS